MTLRFWGDRGVSGFCVDVAHGLAKDLQTDMGEMANQEMMQHLLLEKMKNGAPSNIDPQWDRDEVHEIYKEWRKVL